jgi:hypothetical protein
VHLTGEKAYWELPGYLRQFSVCTLPFRMNQLTRSVDPVKVYEYLSQGKPVVATPLPDLAPISGLLYFAEAAEEFARQIDSALAEPDDSLARKRMSFASQNTWGSRVELLSRSIKTSFPLVSILLKGYNSRQSSGPCLDSIHRNTAYPSYEVILVDDDDARTAKGEYVVLLSADTIVTWGWLDRLMRPLRDPSIGLVAPGSNFPGNPAKIDIQYRSLEEMDRLAFQRSIDKWGRSIPFDAAPVCCCILPRNVWKQIGEPLNEDVTARVKQAGYRMIAAEDCFIHSNAGGPEILRKEDSGGS